MLQEQEQPWLGLAAQVDSDLVIDVALLHQRVARQRVGRGHLHGGARQAVDERRGNEDALAAIGRTTRRGGVQPVVLDRAGGGHLGSRAPSIWFTSVTMVLTSPLLMPEVARQVGYAIVLENIGHLAAVGERRRQVGAL